MSADDPVRAATQAVLRRLLAERGIARYALFLVSGEGVELPGEPGGPPIEAVSGFVLDAQGRVYGFWLTWDPAIGHRLDPWYEVTDPSEFAGDPEFERARANLGLADPSAPGGG